MMLHATTTRSLNMFHSWSETSSIEFLEWVEKALDSEKKQAGNTPDLKLHMQRRFAVQTVKTRLGQMDSGLTPSQI